MIQNWSVSLTCYFHRYISLSENIGAGGTGSTSPPTVRVVNNSIFPCSSSLQSQSPTTDGAADDTSREFCKRHAKKIGGGTGDSVGQVDKPPTKEKCDGQQQVSYVQSPATSGGDKENLFVKRKYVEDNEGGPSGIDEYSDATAAADKSADEDDEKSADNDDIGDDDMSDERQQLIPLLSREPDNPEDLGNQSRVIESILV